MYPEVNSEIMQAMVNVYKESGWLPEWASPGHKRNLLDPGLTHVGVGVVGRYFVLAMVRLAP